MIMGKAWLLAKCMHTPMFRGGVGQEMEVENTKNWKYIGFSIKFFSRAHGYATDMTWICQIVRTYSVWECLATQTRLNRHGICYKGLLLSAQNRKLRCCYLGIKKKKKKTVSLTLSQCTPRRCMVGEQGKAPLVLNIDKTCRRIVSSTPRPLYPWYCEDCGFQYEARLD